MRQLKQVIGIYTDMLDSKEPDWSKFQEFLKSEVRYTSLMKDFPAEAEILFKAAEENAKWRYNTYKRLSEMQYSDVPAAAEVKEN
jgi:pyruvate-ferredoxin/flavodoxin oxidoreductase